MSFDKTVREAVLSRDGHRCQRCGSADDLEAHHMLPEAYGGKDESSNGITLCQNCHTVFKKKGPARNATAGFASGVILKNRLYLKKDIARDVGKKELKILTYPGILIGFACSYGDAVTALKIAIASIELAEKRGGS